ncbi:dihydrofolate reductase family protein [Streptomyces bambusae]|uniref:dihydrofolate reductase family protein n=1 Tax=Streptomyces bambusae TaxID=1550616 RepID=UPI001CFEFB7E|nr:dihydrofolate reductase family protein [Streptomyces bambusae]MCB5164105.1 dihydrofolate reductase family protein [Streptomyces bambusae]
MPRKLVFMSSVSLDGYFEGPDREIDWHRVDDELHHHFNQELAAMGAFLSGRVTHQLMEEFWPTADQDPANAGPMAEFAAIWRNMPKYVYSRTLKSAGWNTTVVGEVVPDEVRALKDRPGGDLVLGGARLAAEFLRHGLVDEFRLYVHPVVLGAGHLLFPPSGTLPQTPLHLVESRTFGNGVVLLRHRTEPAA